MCFRPAFADAPDKMVVGPPPAWVVQVPPPPPRAADGAIDFRLVDIQTLIDAGGMHQTYHQIARVLTPEGLAILGNFGVAWQPTISGARIHMVTIRRDGVAIDLLRDGSGFQILRREVNLEKLQVDGVLTAVLAMRDLRVGDELETSWTLDVRNPVLGDKSENRQFFTAGPKFGRLFLRYSWPKGRDVRSLIGSALPKAVPVTGSNSGFLIDKTDYAAPQLPEGAPTRFAFNNAIQIAEFSDWHSVATTMRPLYDNAAVLPPESAIRTEIRRISGLSTDPIIRATEALHTVQSQIRYFARFDGLGGYKPETADAVWTGRVGDCKGKTVLLIALLRGLGIEAEAALVSSGGGDGIDTALPMPSRFDHVIVRAVVAGKTYWLDGTRLGDRSIETVKVPPFKWALPISIASSSLVRLVATDPVQPEEDWRFDLDARAGIDKPAKVTGIAIFRGEKAAELRSFWSLMAKDDRDRLLRKTWSDRYDWIKVDSITYAYDEATAEIRYDMSGTGEMDWNNKGDETYNNYEADGATLGQYVVSKRLEALQAIAPIYVAPRFEATRQTILLPDGGKGFKLNGGAIDSTIAGINYRRTVSLVGERFDMTRTTHSREGEISYIDAVAADKAVDELFKKRLFINLPASLATKPLTLTASNTPFVTQAPPFKQRGKAAKAELIAGNISDEDYPPEAIRDNLQGLTVVGFDINMDGRVTNCGIVETSGSQALDDKSCALIRERFVFKPARAPDGSATSEARTQRITWRMPETPQSISAYDVTYRYTQGTDGIARNCISSGTPIPPTLTAEQCAKAGNGIIMTDKNGMPISVIVTQHHVQTVEPVAAVVNSGNPR